MFACLYRPPAPESAVDVDALLATAREFSPRYQRHRDDLVSIDVSGLDRLIGPPRTIGEELRRDAAAPDRVLADRREDIARVRLRKKLLQWELRFEGLRFEGHHRRRTPGLVFVPLASQPVVHDLRRLGWVVEEDFPAWWG